MSLLIELIKTIAEAIEESRTQRPTAMPRPIATAPRADELPRIDSREPIPPLRTEAARPKAEARQVPARPVEAERQRAEALAQAAARARTAKAKAAASARIATPAERVARLTQDPGSLRDLVVLKEILDRPLALRPGRR